MKKKSTIKYKKNSLPNYQFGGLNLPFLDQYTNLNKQWGDFWKGGDYFKQRDPLTIGFGDGSTMLDTTVKRNQGALNLYTDTQTRANNNYKGEWGDDAHNFYYRQDWDSRNPNATQADKDRFDQYASFEKINGGLNANDMYGALGAAGINPGDYSSWEKARNRDASKFGAAYDKSRDIFDKDLPMAKKQMGAAMTNSAAGIFSGLNYLNAYKAPEAINMEEGFQGVQIAQKGATVKPTNKNENIKTFKNDPEYFNNKTFEPWQIKALSTGQVGIDENGVLHKLDEKVQVPQEWLDVTSNNYDKSNIKEKWQADARQQQAMQGLNEFYNNPLSGFMGAGLSGPGKSALHYLAKQAGEELISNSLNTYKDSLQYQDGGSVNTTGYTPGTPTANNKINIIPGGNITMETTPQMKSPLLGIVNGGAKHGLIQKLEPGKNYNYIGAKSVAELPLMGKEESTSMAQYGGMAGALQSLGNQGFMPDGLSEGQANYLNQISGGNGSYAMADPALNMRMLAGYTPTKQSPSMQRVVSNDPYADGSIYQQGNPSMGTNYTLPDDNEINPKYLQQANNRKLVKGGTQKVADYQQMLKDKGYNIAVDGAWGPKTKAAYEDFIGKKAPSKTAVQSGKAKVASNLNKATTTNAVVNGINPIYNNDAMRGIVEKEKQNTNFTPNPSHYKRGDRSSYKAFAKDINSWNDPTKKYIANKLNYSELLQQHLPNDDGGYSGKITPYELMRLQKLAEKKGYYAPNKQYGGTIPKLQFGGMINNDHSFPVHPITEEFTEIQAEVGENVLLTDGTIVNVKADKLHKHVDKNFISDILPPGAEVFSNDPKMKLSLDTKIGGVAIKDMTLGKTVFEYKENEMTAGPKDIMLSTIWGKKKELTPAELVNNVKNMFEVRDQKDDFFVQRANQENKEQRLKYLEVIKAFSEFKKPKSKRESIAKAQYGMKMPSMNTGISNIYNQPYNNAIDGVMGYNNKALDPMGNMDNAMKSMYNVSSVTSPKLFQDGGHIPHAQLGELIRYATPIGWVGGYFANKAKKKQEKQNALDQARYNNITDEYTQGVQQTGMLSNVGALTGLIASQNVPDLKYNDYSANIATLNDSYGRQNAMLDAQKYTAINNTGGAGSLARLAGNNENLGGYLAAMQAQSNNASNTITNQQVSLESERAKLLSDLRSRGLDNRYAVENNKDTQLYNARLKGLENVSNSVTTSFANNNNARYEGDINKMTYEEYLRNKANEAYDKTNNRAIRIGDSIGQIGMMVATGGLSGLAGGNQQNQQGQPSNENPYGFNGTSGYDMSNYTSNPYGFNGVSGDPRYGGQSNTPYFQDPFQSNSFNPESAINFGDALGLSQMLGRRYR